MCDWDMRRPDNNACASHAKKGCKSTPRGAVNRAKVGRDRQMSGLYRALALLDAYRPTRPTLHFVAWRRRAKRETEPEHR